MIVNLSNNLGFILNKIKYENISYTIAPDEATNKSDYDFSSLEECLTYIETLWFTINSKISLVFETGTYYLERSVPYMTVGYNLTGKNIDFVYSSENDRPIITFTEDQSVHNGWLFDFTGSTININYLIFDYQYGGMDTHDLEDNTAFCKTSNTHLNIENCDMIGGGYDSGQALIDVLGYSEIYIDNCFVKYFENGFIYAHKGTINAYVRRSTIEDVGTDFHYYQCNGFIYVDEITYQGDYSIQDRDVFLSDTSRFAIISRDDKIAAEDKYRTIKDTNHRPVMNGKPRALPYYQTDIGIRIYYDGKDDEGNDIWVDYAGNEV